MPKRKGWSTLETVLVLPVLVFMLYLMVQISLLLVAKISLTYANYLGVMAVTRNGGDCDKTKELIRENLKFLQFNPEPKVECDQYQPNYYRVKTIVDYKLALPMLPDKEIKLESQAYGYGL